MEVVCLSFCTDRHIKCDQGGYSVPDYGSGSSRLTPKNASSLIEDKAPDLLLCAHDVQDVGSFLLVIEAIENPAGSYDQFAIPRVGEFRWYSA